MTEDFLHFIWQYQLINHTELFSTDGELIKVLKPGNINTNSGPDFSMAKIEIGKTIWAGNIEIHLKTSDWFKHEHQHDKKYEHIILHVVYEHDLVEQKFNFPLVALKNIIKPETILNYKNIIQEKGWIPCNQLIKNVEPFKFTNGLESLAIERLINKSRKILALLNDNSKNWEETLYQSVARSFGLKINADAFEKLVKCIPQKIISKHKNNITQIEALLFGTAGFLNETLEDPYYKTLQKEYQFLQAKYDLPKMNLEEWHFLRLRPASFPTIRIAQFAQLFHHSVHLFSVAKESNNFSELEKLFKISTSEYWTTHYRFGVVSNSKEKDLGKSTFHLIILNSIAPVLFAYGFYTNNETIKEKVISFLEKLPAEKNNIIEQWAKIKYQAKNALESQALLQLKNEYCHSKKCLQCHVGIQLLKNNLAI